MSGVGAYDAAEAEFPTVLGREDHVGALDAPEFVEDGARAVAQPGALLPLLQGFQEHVGEEADEDVRLDPGLF